MELIYLLSSLLTGGVCSGRLKKGGLQCGPNSKQGTNVAHNVRGGLLIDLTIVAIALLLRYTLSMSLKLTDITQWNVGAVVLEQF